MPTNERGQFVRDNMNIPLPTLSGIYKIFIISILIFPWYVILKNKDFSTMLFSGILGKDFCDCPLPNPCPIPPICPICPACPILPPKCPKPPNIRCLPCPINGGNGTETNETTCPPCECQCPG